MDSRCPPSPQLDAQRIQSLVCRWKAGETIGVELLSRLAAWKQTGLKRSSGSSLQRWRDIFAAVLLAELEGMTAPLCSMLSGIYSLLKQQTPPCTDSLSLALDHCVAAFLDLPYPDPEVPVGFGGSVSRRQDRGRRLGALPKHGDAALTACLWVLYARKRPLPYLQERCAQAVQWARQEESMQTGGAAALFCRAEEYAPERRLRYTQQLFQAFGLLSGQSAYLQMVYNARQHAAGASSGGLELDALDQALQGYLEQWGEIKDYGLAVPAAGDWRAPSIAYQVRRHADAESWLCLDGAGTGLGAARWGALSLRCYGPCRSPLGDMASFGIQRSLSRKVEWIDSSEAAPSLSGMRGTVGTVSYQSDLDDVVLHPLWLEIEQSWNGHTLDLNVHPLRDPSDPQLCYMAFFFSADAVCFPELDDRLSKGSMAHWEGAVQRLDLELDGQRVQVSPGFLEGELHVIPLAGERVFWGADFMLAYSLHHVTATAKWSIGPSIPVQTSGG